MVYFDLDGVLRSLSSVVWEGKQPTSWNQTNEKGQDVIGIINDNLDLLVAAHKTKYCDPVLNWLVDNAKPLIIITSQLKSWHKYTDEWIDENIGGFSPYFKTRPPKVYYVAKPEQKMDMLKEQDVIIEDYPKFEKKDYKKVCLIDYPYNRDVSGEICRIRKPQELLDTLEDYMK